MARKAGTWWAGIDVGGTNIAALVASPAGVVRARKKDSTPRKGGPEAVVARIVEVLNGALDKAGLTAPDVAGIGLAVPASVERQTGAIFFAPNTPLEGLEILPAMQEHFRVPVAVGNDVDMGLLGEHWLGAARDCRSAIGLFIGTGIGGGIILDDQLIWGRRGTTAELGHMIMDPAGPKCGCGQKGCFEALASRTAMERDIRARIRGGDKSILTDLMDKKSDRIRSKMLRKALSEHDPVVTEVIRDACDAIALACLSLRHALDPEVLVLGGGVLEACETFMMPRIEKRMARDTLGDPETRAAALVSALGDDAVALGAVALAQQAAGRDPYARRPSVREYPTVRLDGREVHIGRQSHDQDVYIRVDGKVKARKKRKSGKSASKVIDVSLARKICKAGPSVWIVGSDASRPVRLGNGVETWLAHHRIDLRAMDLAEAIETYNSLRQRKAMLLQLPD
jgi:glucokinase